MIIRNDEQRTALIEGGKRLGEILLAIAQITKPGATTAEIGALAEKLILDGGDEPCFKGYTPEGAAYPYPSALCISVNDEVVHGIPSERILKEGDIVGLDLGLRHGGIVVDSAITVPVGTASTKDYALMSTTQQALETAIAAARPGARVGDISHAIEKTFEGTSFKPVRDLGGHGVGERVHEEPFIPNAGAAGTGEEIVAGMVLALEPIANDGKASVLLANDGYTYRTRDGSRSAHFEHTILVEDKETIVVTRRVGEVS
jgi:methionyl aminopeptidase